MPVTYEAIRSMFEASGVGYMVEPNDGTLLFGSTSESGQHLLVQLRVEADGSWLQLRSVGLLKCPPTSKHLPAVLRLLAELNYYYRCIKLGWGSEDGELAAYADLCVGDSQATQPQIFSLIGFFLRLLGDIQPRLLVTATTGKDPGRAEKEEAMV
jgi:hypothetical protein